MTSLKLRARTPKNDHEHAIRDSHEAPFELRGKGLVPAANAMNRLGLECLLGSTRVAIPIESVARVIDFTVTGPTPLGAPFVGGLGTFDRQVVVSVHIEPSALPASRGGAVRAAKGVLLEVGEGEIGWALEVTQVKTVVRVNVGEAGRDPTRPSWVRDARASDGGAIAWVDVSAMIAALTIQTEVASA